MTWKDKTDQLPEITDLQDLQPTAPLVDEVTLRGGTFDIPETDDPANGIQAGVIQLSRFITNFNEAEAVTVDAAVFVQVETHAELETGKYWVFRAGSRVYFHADDYGKTVSKLEYYGSGTPVTAKFIADMNNAAKDVAGKMAALTILDFVQGTPELGQVIAWNGEQAIWMTVEGGGVTILNVNDFTATPGAESVTLSGTVTVGEAVGIMVQADDGGGFVDFVEYTAGDITAFPSSIEEAIAAGTYDFRASARADVSVEYGSAQAPWSSVVSGVEVLTTISVSSVSPTNLASDQYTFLGQGTNIYSLGVGRDISCVLDTDLDPLTVDDTTVLAHDGTGYLTGTVSYSAANKQISFVPDDNFGFDKTITMTLLSGASGILGSGGEQLAADYTWQFSTFATQLTDPEWDVIYPGDVMPSVATPAWAEVNNAGGTSYTASIVADADASNGDALQIISTGLDTDAWHFQRLAESFSDATGLTVDARYKSVSGYKQRVRVYNGAWYAAMEVFPTNIVPSIGTSFPLSALKYREYRVTIKDGVLKIYVDKNPLAIITANLTNSVVSNQIYVGQDAATATASEGYWDFVKYFRGGAHDTAA